MLYTVRGITETHGSGDWVIIASYSDLESAEMAYEEAMADDLKILLSGQYPWLDTAISRGESRIILEIVTGKGRTLKRDILNSAALKLARLGDHHSKTDIDFIRDFTKLFGVLNVDAISEEQLAEFYENGVQVTDSKDGTRRFYITRKGKGEN
jgi:hypothetical protein